METTYFELTQQYQALEAEMLNTPKSNSHRRSLLVAQMKEVMKLIKTQPIHES
jgi:hypothetical protein